MRLVGILDPRLYDSTSLLIGTNVSRFKFGFRDGRQTLLWEPGLGYLGCLGWLEALDPLGLDFFLSYGESSNIMVANNQWRVFDLRCPPSNVSAS